MAAGNNLDLREASEDASESASSSTQEMFVVRAFQKGDMSDLIQSAPSLRYGSLFSGIEAASVAFTPLGWQPQWFAEIDGFCSKVLAKHWPDVQNLGDVINPKFAALAKPVELIIGGSPCQSFSTAGKRRGFTDPRGKLAIRYCQIVRQMQPRWFIWENVPGVLSSNNGEDFEVIINEVVKSGYSVCWRVLDARWFGLPQHRERLFVVGRLGNTCPSDVLLEFRQDTQVPCDIEPQANSRFDGRVDFVPICLRGRKHGVAMEFMNCFGCLRATTGYGIIHVWDGKGVRRLTPLEYERLQGLPDNHTKLDASTPDSLRYKAIGNSMCVPVVRWIGTSIMNAGMEASRPSDSPVRILNISTTTRKDNTMFNPPMIAPMFPENELTENSTLDELAAFALVKQERIFARDKMNAEDLWLMGQALEWAKEKVPSREWEKWWKAKGFKKTYVWQARKLHENAPSLDAVKNLGVTEALVKFEVVCEKKPQAKTAPNLKIVDESALPVEKEEAPTPDKGADTPEPSNEDEDENHPTDPLAEAEEKDFKEWEESIRPLTPHVRAVAILHALELLRDDLQGQEVDEELQGTFTKIAQLAEELKGSHLVAAA